MHLTEEELKQIIKEEFNNLISEEEIDEKLFGALKNLGKGLLSKASNIISRKPNPEASAGVGRAFARYKVPQKQPAQPEEPEQTDLSKTRQSFGYQPDTGIEDTEWSKESEKYYNQSRFPSSKKPLQIGPYREPVKPVEPARQLGAPDSPTEPKQLSAAGEIITSAEHGETVDPYNVEKVSLILNRYIPLAKEKGIPDQETKTIVGYLIANNRILSNPTRVPRGKEFPEISEQPKTMQEIIGVSMQQGGLSFDTLENYIYNLHNILKKEREIDIPVIHIHAIMKFIYDDGRLAISAQKLRRMSPEQEPKKQTESKFYNNFYNNWKKYAKTGVKI